MMISILFLLVSLALTSVIADYSLTSITETAYGWEGFLSLSSPAPYGNDIANLSLSVWFETDTRLRVKLFDTNNERWEVPQQFLHVDKKNPPKSSPKNPLYEFQYTKETFSFQIIRKSSGQVLFDTSIGSLFFSNQYIEFSTGLPPNSNMYGFGERIVPLRLTEQDYVIWTNDWGNPTLKNLYGHHPIYHRVESDGNAHAVVLYNSNMMDGELKSDRFTYKTIGGIIDLYFFLGPSPLELTTQYTEIIGRPFMPPAWSVGWHQCRWGYNSANTTLQVVLNYTANGMPIDAIWNDIDWMRDYIFGTYNDELGSGGYNIPDVRNLNKYLDATHRKHVQIVDPNIPALLKDKDGKDYLPYVEGKRDGIFTRHPANDTLLYGKQWPAVTVAWPDWTNPGVTDWWERQFRNFGEIAGQLGGVWLDMNEPSSFCAGQISASCIGINDTSRVVDPLAVPHPPVSSPTDIPYPPYQPGAQWQKMEDHSFNISSHHYLGQHYNVKEFWGMCEQRATAAVMERVHKQRAFTLSRSTFMGSGSHGAHWLGDNNASWDDLYNSIPEVLSMGIYGITMIGADICGFGGDTTDELCARWIQLGSLYPFARDHSSTGTRMQEPYQFGDVYVAMNKNSLLLRYSLLAYIYQLFVESHLLGYPVWRALYMEFTTDSNTWAIDRQFMLGAGLMGIPVLEKGSTTATGYLPNGDWFNFYTQQRLTIYDINKKNGSSIEFSSLIAKDAMIPLIQRGGFIVAQQHPLLTSYETLKTDFTLNIALNHSGDSYGRLVLDDGITIGNIDRDEYHRIDHSAKLSLDSNNLISGVIRQNVRLNSKFPIKGILVEQIIVMGLDLTDKSQIGSPVLTVNGKVVPSTNINWSIMSGALYIDATSAKSIPIDAEWKIVFGQEELADTETIVTLPSGRKWASKY